MSQYPYSGYPYPGQPPPNPYAYQTYPVPPAIYGAPYDPNTVPPPPGNYYAMNQNAYSYNQQSMPPSAPGIPGLGIAGPPASVSPYHPPPPPTAASPWGQSAYHTQPPTFAAGAPGAPLPVPQATPQQYVPPPKPVSLPTQARPQTVQHPTSLPPNPARTGKAVSNTNNMPAQTTDDIEEGELSEGQFEDLYEPLPPVAQSKNKPAVAPTRPVVDRSLPDSAGDSAGDSAADTPDAGFYTEDDGDDKGRSEPAKGANGQKVVREKSGSYSPYLSPREIDGDNTPKETARSLPIKPKSSAPSLPGFHIQPRSQVSVPGLGMQQKNASHGADGASNAGPSHSQSQMANGNASTVAKSPFTNLVDAKKEAQKAILRLWPMGVKYQHYVDEGIDEKVVKQLFSDLHLDMSTGKPAQPAAAQPAQTTKAKELKTPAATPIPAGEKQQATASQDGAKSVAGDKADQTESRKDRIARLLAEKKAKGSGTVAVPTTAATTAPVAVSMPAPGSTQAPVVAASAVSKASVAVNPPLNAKPAAVPVASGTTTPVGGKPVKTKEEKERLLRQKMEELQRARAQKADATKAAASTTQSSASGTVTPLQSGAAGTPGPEPQAVAAASGSVHGIPSTTAIPTGPKGDRPSLPPGVPTGPRGSVTPTATTAIPNHVQSKPSPGQKPQRDAGPIPGLLLSSAPSAPATVNQRKRPVAADFVAYEAPAPKRPFGQERQDSSLVIDVSDGSDDDVEMDLESNPDAPLPQSRANSSAQMATSFGNYPPLTDTVRRQNASPALSAQMTAAALGKKEQEMLAAKERAIQEMKRKIAEAEAKAKLKAKQASSGAQTPNPTSATPPETSGSVLGNPRDSSVVERDDAPSTQLLSEAVAAEAPKPTFVSPTSEDQGNQHLPEVLEPKPVETDKERRKREKAERMRKLQEEMARLAAEDDDDEEEEDQGQEAPSPAREAPVEKPAPKTQLSGDETNKALSTVSKDERQDGADGAKLAETAATGPKSLEEPTNDLGDDPELDGANEAGEIDEAQDVSMTDAPQFIAVSEESAEQTDVDMEGPGHGTPAAAAAISNASASDAGNSEQSLPGGNITGPFLCPVEGCIKSARGFSKQKALRTHIRRKHKDVFASMKARKGSHNEHQNAPAAIETESQTTSDEVEDGSRAGESSASFLDNDISLQHDTQSESRGRSASYEPPEASVPAGEQIAIPSPTPAAVDSPLPSNKDGSTTEQTKLGQISDVSRSRDKTQEVETMSKREVLTCVT
ncbi:hypothetical protein DL546_006438 [Coniochaeta pulveracea]|uniref:Uncharacterized protein n=1 Tax=Coniochaeta pulveracea TaxID=177199 RepID=A0A420YCA4_9PEZI|nr:hypothetical protein DL546_006438 [Coniochaeta pulveracea]